MAVVVLNLGFESSVLRCHFDGQIISVTIKLRPRLVMSWTCFPTDILEIQRYGICKWMDLEELGELLGTRRNTMR